MAGLDIARALGRISKVRLPGGVVGKVAYAVIAVSVSLGSIGVFAHQPLVAAAAVVGIVVVAFPMLWRLISFAERNPQAAILEGTEFLVHQQMMIAAKDRPELPDETPDIVLLQPELLEGPDEAPPDEPDRDAPQAGGG